MKASKTDFFLYYAFGFWFEFYCHTSNLAPSFIRRRLGLGGRMLAANRTPFTATLPCDGLSARLRAAHPHAVKHNKSSC